VTKPSKKKALEEIDGIPEPDMTSQFSIDKFKKKRSEPLQPDSLTEAILKGDVTALSRAITLIESKNPTHKETADTVIKDCLPYANKSIRIGITGVPGVGKSTFIETFGKYLTQNGKKLAVLAVDPSSSLTKGSILGDKTRMEELVRDTNAYIRPSASGDSLGGVARKTRESIILCEAAGFDTILIETVGVGQNETAVHSMVDFFLLLKLAGAGDELQGIKRGIMEMADAIVINKADGDNLRNAKNAQMEFKRALHYYPDKEYGWATQVLLCSALKNSGIEEINHLIDSYVEQMKSSGYFFEKRFEQNKYWLLQTIEERLKHNFFGRPEIKAELDKQLKLISANNTTPFAAADYLMGL